MPRPFARHYDTIYADKNYDRDVGVFEALLQDGSLAGKKVLELGAGTGNHTLRLARRAGSLTSVEIDADFCTVLEDKVAAARATNVTCFCGPVEELPESGFDSAAAFFHVLNYIGPGALERFLDALACRLKPGARFIADVWNGAAASSDPPRAELREKQVGATRVVQSIRPHFERGSRAVALDFEISLKTSGAEERIEERLSLYLWFREELESMLEQAGFADVRFWDYRSFPAAATEHSWILWLRAVRK